MSLLKLGRIGGALNGLRKMVLFGPRYSARSYISHLNKMGADIDENTIIIMPETVFLDDNAPYLLKIGRNVAIAAGVTILTHDACWHVMKSNDGIVRGHVAPVTIGNNVFIGMNSMILCNVTICDNVIISAGSVVTSHIKKPGVYAGNPARLVVPYEQYCAIRDGRQLKEAYTIAERYYCRFGKKPPQEIFKDYFWIFAPRRVEELHPDFMAQMKLYRNYQKSEEEFLNSAPDFDGYDAFWEWCLKKIKEKDDKKQRKRHVED